MRRDLNHSRRAFTLIEVLLALTLTTLVVGVTGRIAIQTVETRRFAEQEFNRLRHHDAVFDHMEEDFAGLLWGMPGESSPVSVTAGSSQILQLSTLTAVPNVDADLHTPRKPCRVRYQFVNDQDRGVLVRESVDRTTFTQIPVRETIDAGIASFEVEVLVKGQWLRSIDSKDPKSSDIQAVRVTIRWMDDEMPESRIFRVRHGL